MRIFVRTSNLSGDQDPYWSEVTGGRTDALRGSTPAVFTQFGFKRLLGTGRATWLILARRHGEVVVLLAGDRGARREAGAFRRTVRTCLLLVGEPGEPKLRAAFRAMATDPNGALDLVDGGITQVEDVFDASGVPEALIELRESVDPSGSWLDLIDRWDDDGISAVVTTSAWIGDWGTRLEPAPDYAALCRPSNAYVWIRKPTTVAIVIGLVRATVSTIGSGARHAFGGGAARIGPADSTTDERPDPGTPDEPAVPTTREGDEC